MFRRRRDLLYLGVGILMGAVLLGSATPAVSQGGSPRQSQGGSPRYEVEAYVGGRLVPVAVGSVLAAGEKIAGFCSLDQEIGIHITVAEGDTAPAVTWMLDDECRVVVVSIDETPPADSRPVEG